MTADAATDAATDVAALVERWGSPLYVYDLDAVDAAWDRLGAALPVGAVVYYSLKANPHPAVVERLRARGARAEVSSTGELRAALAAGFRPQDVLVTGPAKGRGGIEDAVALGCRRFSVESPADLDRASRVAHDHGAELTVLLRVNVDEIVSPADGLALGGVPSPFGMDLSAVLDDLPRLLDRPGLTVAGAHFFLATNLSDQAAVVGNLAAAVAAAGKLAEAGLAPEVLDLGGGFGAPFARPGPPVGLPTLRGELDALVAAAFPAPAARPELWFESGRYLVGAAGTLVSTVVDVKHSKGERFVVLDSGIHHLGGMAGLKRLPPFDLGVAAGPAGPPTRAHVVGPLCTTLDTWARRAELGELAPGDLVTVPNVGAYGLTASLLAFLSHDCPWEVAVDRSGVRSASRIVLDRHTSPEPSAPTQ